MTNEPNQADADETNETTDDPIEGADAQGAAPAPSPTAADADDGDLSDESDAAESEDTDSLAEDSSDAGLAEDTSDPGLAEDTSDPGLAEDTSDPGLAEDSSDVESEDADDEEADEAAEASDADDDDEDDAEAEAAETDEDDEEAEEVDESLDLPDYVDLSEQGVEWLAGLFERMNFDAQAEILEEDGEPRVDISGPDADRLLGAGKLGPKAIEGIETLMQSVFSEDDTASDLYVDVGNQRADHKEMLEGVADDLADRAVDLSKSVTVSGLNSTERRIIHRRLRDNDGVDTESVGDGIFRRLKIEPTS